MATVVDTDFTARTEGLTSLDIEGMEEGSFIAPSRTRSLSSGSVDERIYDLSRARKLTRTCEMREVSSRRANVTRERLPD